ncbi:MAG: hypothetical protein HY329_23565 [Chloroflexi bacterium]|nr:hypothetical protein [Chloroflexota bacterium]
MSEMSAEDQTIQALLRRVSALEDAHAELRDLLELARTRISNLEAQLAGVPEALRATGALSESTEHLLRMPLSAVSHPHEPKEHSG